MPQLSHESTLLLYVLVAVVGVIVLIARNKWHPFVALTLAGLFVGLVSGMPFAKVATVFQEGVGTMLSGVAVVVGLGMILGRLLGESGGARVIATTLIDRLGEHRLDWAMMLIGFIVGLPVFFTVGVVLLVPILFTLLRQTGQPLLRLGIPMVAGLSVAHGLVPPHPGPMAAIGVTHADPGRTILYSILIGLPTAAIAGPLFGRFISQRVVTPPLPPVPLNTTRDGTAPGFWISLLTITLPVILMLTATAGDLFLRNGHPARDWLSFVGSPAVAMLLATLFSFYSFGIARGFSQGQILGWAESSLAPAGSILLVVGAGGGFNKILVASGVGEILAHAAQSTALSPLLLGWMVAALIRIATGSATVAITTAAGLVTPYALTVPDTNMELLVIVAGAGSLVLSHVNDGGFWFVKEYLGLDVTQTLKTWTLMETLISVVVLAIVLLVEAF